ncbi:sulfatase [Calycomorphotria hydatis]|uniref:Arylsulfatase n=1 Tax=Calycomorphotria hydatis TaxID=2528027 RepID=A0A517T794_9PLAN|nr:sulfatase [Calycomorphotria hydatis]QDT64241.1 Arylsulfatase [Calycomorphotria hydatis]
MHRFVFLILCITLSVICGDGKSLGADERPNVLFIAVDDLNDWVGCLGGHPQTLTPHIDQLAQRGVLFTNAHCASPACNPSRAAIFSGQYPDKTDVWSNSSPRITKQIPRQSFLTAAFENAGYHTIGTGKLLHSDRNTEKIFQTYASEPAYFSPMEHKECFYTDEELPSKGTSHPRHIATDPNGKEIVLPLNGMRSDRSPERNSPESFDWGPFDVNNDQMADAQNASWAINHLKELPDGPVFMGVGFFRPHIPMWAPRAYFERFEAIDIELPAIQKNDVADLSSIARDLALMPYTAGSHATVVEYDQWRKAIAGYLACITFIDDQIGRLITALDESSASENTYIVLWSDHGWHLGEKEHWGKWTGWERATRVPMIIVPPKSLADDFASAGSHCDEPVSLIDLYPTLMELCQVKTSVQLDGSSLVPLLKKPNMETDRTVFTVFNEGNVTLRNNRWRYIRYEDGSEELYDHSTDPHEWYNLAGKKDYRSQVERMATLANQFLNR